jgi:hypothetical protein
MNIAHPFQLSLVDLNRKRWMTIMSPEREIAVWREWFAKACSGWEDVEDIEAELREMRGEP